MKARGKRIKSRCCEAYLGEIPGDVPDGYDNKRREYVCPACGQVWYHYPARKTWRVGRKYQRRLVS